jgi:uncharacterized membrane protein
VRRNQTATLTCQICGKSYRRHEVIPGELVRECVVEIIRREHPEWSPERPICIVDLDHYRARYVQSILEQEKGELSAIEQEVVQSLKDQDLISKNINTEFEHELKFGERLSDRVAEVAGSWKFIISFGVVLVTWIAVNSVIVLWRPFDPYPFILLNLVLSCIAALQAPVIMMSQNRQEAKDRLRGEHDYRVNLKAELEIRHLHAKIDELLTHQWQRLLEIQQIQMEMMEELMHRAGRERP